MARYLQMLLAGGVAPTGRMLSALGVATLLAPASPESGSRQLSTGFRFRYGEGWFVGPFGAASDARWHHGSLASFAAWMVRMPDTKQAVVVLINANSELPFNDVNAVMSRLPIGVVKLLRGEPVPTGPSLPEAYRFFNAVAAIIVVGLIAQGWWAMRSRRARWSLVMLLLAMTLLVALPAMGLSAAILAAFAPDLALVLALEGALLSFPAIWRAWTRARRTRVRNRGIPQP